MNIELLAELQDYLEQTGRIDTSEVLTIRVLCGGVSNRTVLVCRSNGERWVMKQALEKLRVADDWFSSPLRVHREALGMRWLAELTPSNTVPRLVFEDYQHHLLAMEAVPEPCLNWKSLLLQGVVDLDLVRQFGELLGTIHRRSFQNRDELAVIFADTEFFESLRVEPYYAYTASRVRSSTAFYERLIEDTRCNRHSIVHGDYSPKNLLVHHDRLILIDHEVIHFGDPGFDLGFSMAHLLSKYHHLPRFRQAFDNAIRTYWQTYLFALGNTPLLDDLQPIAVRHTLGCLLARVRGRSPLEYLNEVERSRQERIVLELMKSPSQEMADLIDKWLECCEQSSER